MLRSRLLLRLAHTGVIALLGMSVLAVAAPQQARAAGMVRECKQYSTGCVSFSGYAGRSVWGYPVNSSGNNCVNYVAYRLARNGVKQQSTMGNGGAWASSARARGYRVDRTPKTGAVAQWNYGSAYAPSYGHVGYVEEVTSSYLVISDSSWGGGYSSRWRVYNGDRNWPSNFIHFKDQSYQPPKSGSFIRVRETGQVYRLVGRTPVYVSTWTAFGGAKPTMDVSSTALATLPTRLAEGTFIRGAQRGEVYKIVGGAPVFVSAWANVGGAKAFTDVDQNAIDKAGSGGAYSRMLATPADDTMLKTTKGVTYRMKAGIAYYSTSLALAQPTTPVLVDYEAIRNATTTGAVKYRHIKGVKALPKLTAN
ncbi:CHAP domain-containing protein [Pedococcus sp. KACC 23699]|uniref:CHAP domain-containing protein n=1 Tax=Pedococcus sp. KACC 23699 TaxID=3149228 RepID=A0AAU7JRF3_9MICO